MVSGNCTYFNRAAEKQPICKKESFGENWEADEQQFLGRTGVGSSHARELFLSKTSRESSTAYQEHYSDYFLLWA